MTLNRACTIMTVKAIDEEKRIITGIASTPSPDRSGDILEASGVVMRSEAPFLWQHDRSQPIGTCTTKKFEGGIELTAQLVKPTKDMPSQLIARLEESWHSIKTGLVKGLSVGFNPIKYAFMDSGGINFLEWELLEVSAVTIPANADCTIQTVKSHAQKLLAASGIKQEGKKQNKSTAGVSAKNSESGKNKMNLAEQIKSFENKRASLNAEREMVMAKAAEEGRVLDAEESESYDNTTADLRSVDEHLKRLRDMETNEASSAKPITKKVGSGVINVVDSAPRVIKVDQKLEKGIGFARFAKALAAANGSRTEALAVAKKHYPDDAKLHYVLKEAVGAGTTTDPKWASSLSEYQEYTQDFIEFLRPQTIIGRFGQGNIPALRQVPFNVRIPAQTSGGSASWVGQGKAKPLTKFDFESITFGFAKVAAIAVLTDELIRFSNPAADALVRNSLAEAVIARLDADFVDPKKVEVSNVSPASITNGIQDQQSSGNPDEDASSAFGSFVSAGLQPSGAVWLMSSTTALSLSMRKNALGQKEYPEMSLLGGMFQGLPVIVSQYVGDQLVLVNAPDIYLADDGGVAVDMSREASLEMQSEPTGDSTAPTGTELVSMFQTNSVAIRAERWINWKRRRTAAVAVISGVNYSAISGS